jgi:hypothetical protein
VETAKEDVSVDLNANDLITPMPLLKQDENNASKEFDHEYSAQSRKLLKKGNKVSPLWDSFLEDHTKYQSPSITLFQTSPKGVSTKITPIKTLLSTKNNK